LGIGWAYQAALGEANWVMWEKEKRAGRLGRFWGGMEIRPRASFEIENCFLIFESLFKWQTNLNSNQV
jgi:hypothetical protein